MRRARNADFVEHEGVTIGIDLGADYCAEHERGINDMRTALGMPSDPLEDGKLLGVAGRTMSVYNERSVFFEKKGGYACLAFEPSFFGDAPRGWKNRELDNAPQKLATAWDGKSFAVVVAEPHIPFLTDLHEAFKKKDVAMWFGNSGNPFQNNGLIVAIASRIPAFARELMLETDEKAVRLRKAVKKTDIAKILKKAGKEYFALSPKWKDEKESSILFWLNPREQNADNYGWFTLEDLLDWAKGKGKIPKKGK